MINLVLPQSSRKQLFAIRQFRGAALGGSQSVNGFISNALAKVARFAVSKGAAFSYAVAVGVAGNLVFHFVQPQVPTPSVQSGAPEAPQSGEKPSAGPAATATIAPKPAVAPIPESPAAAPSAAVSTPAVIPASKPMTALQLPER